MKIYTYDVALSFAGEDRDFVKQVADTLRNNGIRVFYDEFERANLWGKELIEYLEDIYKNKSRYVIIFASKSYLVKDWTNHERKSALNRAFKEKEEYILPIKLDDTVLPGLHESIGHLSAKNLNPFEIASTFMQKIGKDVVSTVQPTLLLYRITKKQFSEDTSGIGSSLYGSRWSSKGNKLFYTATSVPMATLEVLAGINYNFNDFVLVQYAIPANISIAKIYENDLPENWNSLPYSDATIAFGDNWIKSQETCILSVPSSILPTERNYLLNPNHVDYQKLKINRMDKFEFDNRLSSE